MRCLSTSLREPRKNQVPGQSRAMLLQVSCASHFSNSAGSNSTAHTSADWAGEMQGQRDGSGEGVGGGGGGGGQRLQGHLPVRVLHLVHRRAHRLGEAVVVERQWVGACCNGGFMHLQHTRCSHPHVDRSLLAIEHWNLEPLYACQAIMRLSQ